MIPQLAQQRLGYTATWAGLILSPGGLVIIALIPFVGRAMTVVPTKYLIATGFTVMGFALLYSQYLTPTIDFKTLAKIRASQTVGLAFMFVPISTIAYATLPPSGNADASALFTMFRNFFGSLSISFAAAIVTERTQSHIAHLGRHLSPLDRGYTTTLQQVRDSMLALGHASATTSQDAVGWIYQQAQLQASIMAYSDLFTYTAALSFCVVPFCFLFSSKTGGAKGGAH